MQYNFLLPRKKTRNIDLGHKTAKPKSLEVTIFAQFSLTLDQVELGLFLCQEFANLQEVILPRNVRMETMQMVLNLLSHEKILKLDIIVRCQTCELYHAICMVVPNRDWVRLLSRSLWGQRLASAFLYRCWINENKHRVISKQRALLYILCVFKAYIISLLVHAVCEWQCWCMQFASDTAGACSLRVTLLEHAVCEWHCWCMQFASDTAGACS